MSVNSFLELFGKSPFKALEKHIDVAQATSEALTPFFKAVFEQDWTKAQTIQLEISALERDADKIKRQVRIQLPKGLFLPVDRGDLIELIKEQDKIANKAKDIAGRIIGRQLIIPTIIQAEFSDYLKRCLDAVRVAATAINELDELLEMGFKDREVDIVEKLINRVAEIEADTDGMEIRLRSSLRDIETELNPIDVMFLYDIIEWVGDLADQAESVGGRLELLLAR